MLTSAEDRTDGGILIINDLIVRVNIGVTPKEREQSQKVALFIKIHFNNLPLLAYTDSIEDGICYEQVISQIQGFCRSKDFKVIEHLSLEILTFLKSFIHDVKIQVKVQKWPKIKGFKGSVLFECEKN